MTSQLSMRSGNRERKLPVFVSPEELQFVGEDGTSHKQILTLFNPYNFNLRFKVMSNAPHKYTVIESQGTVNSHCCVDLIVCHRLASDGPYDVSDKFRIDLFCDGRQVGWKHVTSTLLKTKSSSQIFDEPSDKMADFSSISSHPSSRFANTNQQVAHHQSGSVILLVLAALTCLFILLLPLEREGPDWPSYLHVTVNQKLIASFALGLLTLAILKS